MGAKLLAELIWMRWSELGKLKPTGMGKSAACNFYSPRTYTQKNGLLAHGGRTTHVKLWVPPHGRPKSTHEAVLWNGLPMARCRLGHSDPRRLPAPSVE